MKQKTDLRVIKTKKAIHNAFIHLLGTKGLTAMTVQDILDEALINRKTFYTYYHDKYDLAEQIASEFLKRFDELLSRRFSDSPCTSPAAFPIGELYAALYQDKKELSAIWSIQTDHINVFSEISERLQKVYRHLAARYETPGDVMLQSYMFSAFVLTSYRHIMETEQTYETHQLLKEYQNIYDVIEKAAQQDAARAQDA
ncbi:MAG: TetR family transcriptional regulator [Eubacteriales bacterium]|nr:TetR family transcriptional regulator [Eubacteriales bacterium]